MAKKSKRKHPRIPYQGKVDLLFPEIEYLECNTQNLSLIGMLINGCQEQEEGTKCDIEFHDDSPASATRPLRVKGEVVRVGEEGIALLFLNMNVRTYNELETLICDNAGDCLLNEDEFFEELPGITH